MSYKPISAEDFPEDLLRRKEFLSLKVPPDFNFRDSAATSDVMETAYNMTEDRYVRPSSHQIFVRNFMNPNTEYTALHLMFQTGCHAPGTKVWRSNGTPARVEDIRSGDALMGDDGLPRRVLRTVTGIQSMYRLETLPPYHKYYGNLDVNLDHLLVVRRAGDTENTVISLRDFLHLYSEEDAHPYYLVRAGILALGSDTEPRLGTIEQRRERLVSLLTEFTPGREAVIRGAPDFLDEVEFIALSLGFLTARMNEGLIVSPNTLGELIPFRILPLGPGSYYGFALDVNNLFLTENFVINHNTGKCHAAGTDIMMADGSIRKVESIRAGEMIMGDDSMPRNVLSLARGRQDMVNVVLDDGSSFCVNRDHIFSVKFTSRKDTEDDHPHSCITVDIPADDIMEAPPVTRQSMWMYKNSIEFGAEYNRGRNPYTDGYSLIIEGVLPPNVTLYVRSRARAAFLGGMMDALDSRGDVIVAPVRNGQRQQTLIIRSGEHTGVITWLLRGLGNRVETLSPDTIRAEIWTKIPVKRFTMGMMLQGVKPSSTRPWIHPYQLYKFTLELRPPAEYYGFAIDGNHRYVLGDFTVTHNTIASIASAMEFIRQYSREYSRKLASLPPTRQSRLEAERTTPSVFVFGFAGAKTAFLRDLIFRHEFGFISVQEQVELESARRAAASGLSDDIAVYKELYSRYKRRVLSKGKGGFFKFFGYDELVNRVFTTDLKLTELEAHALQTGENLDAIINEKIAAGEIQVNTSFVAQFERSLIIADEIHNTYNMFTRNNRGVVLGYLLDSAPGVRLLSLSATPINNAPSEIVELLNFLLPRRLRVSKKDLFLNKRDLRPGGLEKIAELSRGRFSFMRDTSPQYYPAQTIEGDELKLPAEVEGFPAGVILPYLKFIQCPMSILHQQTLNRLLRSATVEPAGSAAGSEGVESTGHDQELSEAVAAGIPPDGQTIFDMVFPNPDSESIGLFRSGDLRARLINAPSDWRDSVGVSLRMVGNRAAPSGSFLHRDSLPRYSTKYAQMLDLVLKIMRLADENPSRVGKIMIYHNRVRGSGVLLIQEILNENGFLDEFSTPVDNTRCYICAKTLAEHTESPPAHRFHPARFIVAHSEIDKASMDMGLTKFNSADNANGKNFLILVGSRIMKESYNVLDCQHQIVVSQPVSIPALIQILGRCNRKNSHLNLPKSQRRVSVYILISTVSTKFPYVNVISPELGRYAAKLADYKVIQQITRAITQEGVDSDLHWDIIMPNNLRQRYFPPNRDDNPQLLLEGMYFEPKYKVPVPIRREDMVLSTFSAYGYAEGEVHMISTIIKRLFRRRPVWTYERLWEAVREPPFSLEVNPKLFTEENFIIALSALTDLRTPLQSIEPATGTDLVTAVSKLFDPADMHLYTSTRRYRIVQVGIYYILAPTHTQAVAEVNRVHEGLPEHFRDKERAMLHAAGEYRERPHVDVETYLRGIQTTPGRAIPIDNIPTESRVEYDPATLNNMISKLERSGCPLMLLLTELSEGFQRQSIESVIVKSMAGLALSRADKKILQLYGDLGVLVYAGEIVKYKDTAKMFTWARARELPGATPVGYLTPQSVKIYTGTSQHIGEDEHRGTAADSWVEVNKLALNRTITWRENDIIVGYLEPAGDSMRFKLRRPVQIIREEVRTQTPLRKILRSETKSVTKEFADTRLIERGIVCTTKSKPELMRVLSLLGLAAGKLPSREARVKRLCMLIFERLVKNEITERTADTKVKWLYGWWDAMARLT